MKKTKKILSLVLAAALLVTATVATTVAYLTSTDEVQNTFTVGNVEINLDEANVVNGVESGRTESGNSYKLLPGQTYVKDPTVTVLAKSEDCYVRTLVKVSDMSKLKAAFPKADYPTFYDANDLFLLQNLVKGWSNDVWEYTSYNNGTYEFRYVGPKATNGVVPYSENATVLEDLFTNVVVPEDVDNGHLAYLDGVKIDVVAHAIQAAGFEDLNGNGTAADEAWAKW